MEAVLNVKICYGFESTQLLICALTGYLASVLDFVDVTCLGGMMGDTYRYYE